MQKCPICLEPLTSGPTNYTVTTPCGHLFHINCVQDWLARGIQKCPKCLRNISKDKLIKVYLEPNESDVQIPQETDGNSRWSKIANSVAYFSEANSVSLISLSNPAGAYIENSNPESTRTNPKTSNPATTQNANTEKRTDSKPSSLETARSNPRRGDPTTTPVQYIRTNIFANADEMVVNTTQNCNPTLIRTTNNAEVNRSDKQLQCCCCFCCLFVCFVIGFGLVFGFLT